MRNEATAVALTSSLRSLRGSRPLYMLPTAPLAEGALVPCFKAADRVDCMAGFFSSEALAAESSNGVFGEQATEVCNSVAVANSLNNGDNA